VIGWLGVFALIFAMMGAEPSEPARDWMQPFPTPMPSATSPMELPPVPESSAPALPLPRDGRGVPVLMYHKVDPITPKDSVGRSLTISPETFEAQLIWLRDHHIRTVTTAELVAAIGRGERLKNAVVLTFDDGYVDAATVAAPLLQKYGAHASFYVSAGFVGDGRHASWAQLREMHAAGMEIGCHGTFHRDLAASGATIASYEVNHCVAALTKNVARPVTYAYAAGKFTPATFALMQEAGLQAALTEIPGAVGSLANRYAWPRYRVNRDLSMRAFAQLAQL
jgi:peptidoglycan/xylan/chitin deacetylase (PgdA/CDA1 family)